MTLLSQEIRLQLLLAAWSILSANNCKSSLLYHIKITLFSQTDWLLTNKLKLHWLPTMKSNIQRKISTIIQSTKSTCC